jgi:hypothetical protein
MVRAHGKGLVRLYKCLGTDSQSNNNERTKGRALTQACEGGGIVHRHAEQLWSKYNRRVQSPFKQL